MSLFASPAEHAANPPESWQVVKEPGSTKWGLMACQGRALLDLFTTRHAALEARHDSWLTRLYEKEARWYAGEPIEGWRPYSEVSR